MNDIGKRIKEARMALKLSVKELSEKTKIRVFVIEAIESGDYSVMSDIYIKSFIKTLTQFLKIPYSDPILEIKPVTTKKKKFDDETVAVPEKKIENKQEVIVPKKEYVKETLSLFKNKTEKNNNHFAEIFKKSNIDKDKRYMYLNRAVYFALIIAVIVAVYFAFSSLNKNSEPVDNSELSKKGDTVSLEDKTNSLFSYFEKPDSLRLTAKAHDTIWIRVLSDGKSINEALLKPGMEESWGAKEYFMVDMGNVGGAKIYRNEELLPQFGKTGSVVKNIKITATEVLNAYTQKPDSVKVYNRKKKEPEPEKKPRMIEQSTIYSTPQFNLPKRDSIRND
jgi:cytoskeletal protein RodZ